MTPLPTEPVNVIEIRAAKNGYVISAWNADPYRFNSDSRGGSVRGYQTYVCDQDPEHVAETVKRVLAENAITMDITIPPARDLP